MPKLVVVPNVVSVPTVASKLVSAAPTVALRSPLLKSHCPVTSTSGAAVTTSVTGALVTEPAALPTVTR